MSRLLSLVSVLVALWPSALFAQDDERAAREAEFARTMTGAQLVGFFTADDAPEGQAPQKDSYTLGEVVKLEGDTWRFESKIAYGGNDLTIPITLQIKWAGDTPVITMTDYAVPMLGTFTARVMFYDGQYAGIWSGAGHAGQMYGEIVPGPGARSEGEGEEHGGEGDDGEGEHGDGDRGGDGGPGASGAEPVASPAADDATDWPSFRGPSARGYANGFPTADTWDMESGENVLWKRGVPGLSHASPIVFGEHVYVLTAIRADGDQELRVGLYGDIAPVADEGVHIFQMYCFDKRTGEPVWERTIFEGVPAIKRHTKGSHAASTPATDGEHVVAFLGTEGLFCLDMDGETLWEKDLGTLDSGYYLVPDAQWGFASSPVIYDGKVIVQCDVQGQSFLATFDVKTGEELWRTNREEVPTWGSPTVAEREGGLQVVVNGYKHIGGYDLETGEEVWKLAGGGDIPVPTPIVGDGLIYIMNAHGAMAPIYAVRTSATGEIAMEHEHMAWSRRNQGNYMQTPLVYGGLLYGCSDGGIIACYDAAGGEQQYRERLASGGYGFTASAVAAEGKIYLTQEDGNIHVVAAGPQFELLAVNELGEPTMATPAVSEGVLYWRTQTQLVAIAP